MRVTLIAVLLPLGCDSVVHERESPDFRLSDAEPQTPSMPAKLPPIADQSPPLAEDPPEIPAPAPSPTIGSEAEFLNALNAVVVFRFDATHPEADTLDGAGLANQSVDGFSLLGGTDVAITTASELGAVSLSADGEGLSSPPNVDLRDPALTIAAVIGDASQGNWLTLAPYGESVQSLSVGSDRSENVEIEVQASPESLSRASADAPGGTWNLISVTIGGLDDLIATMNGRLLETQTTGEAARLGLVNRTLFLRPRKLLLRELVVYRGELDATALGVVLRDLSARHNLDGIQIDPAFDWSGHSTTDDQVTPAFTAASEVLADRCTPCHAHAHWSRQPEEFFLSSNLVEVGNAEASPLYFRVTGSLGPGGPKNMPATGTISLSETELLADWINTL
ncbi:MAG: hypothetical protein AAF654_00380 [Myxococcota bacterium]